MKQFLQHRQNLEFHSKPWLNNEDTINERRNVEWWFNKNLTSDNHNNFR
jgi:hypothetical protein